MVIIYLRSVCCQATFLAAVHAQILGFSIHNSATNIFTFTGILPDVVEVTLSRRFDKFPNKFEPDKRLSGYDRAYDANDLEIVNSFLNNLLTPVGILDRSVGTDKRDGKPGHIGNVLKPSDLPANSILVFT